MSEPAEQCEVVVIGAGAAGMMCAIEAGRRGRRVTVLEHNEAIGRKIAISGGGRCNFTNVYAGPDNYHSSQPNFCKSALARYTPWDFVALVEKHGIAYHEKKLGQQFCDLSSRQIIQMLEREAAEAGVRVRLGCRVEHAEKPGRFRLRTSHGLLEAEALVIATGGLSFPKLGATDLGYRLAKQFGLRVTELRPGLVPLTLGEKDLARFGSLSGLSLPVVARTGDEVFAESLLFTHRGLSGPAILQISSFWKGGEELHLDLFPLAEARGFLTAGRAERAELVPLLAKHWPRRFAEVWMAARGESKPLAHFTNAEIIELASALHRWRLQPAGTEGYAKAEVTSGGVDTAELSSRTMESRSVPGLYFIGEVVDVTGWLGGFNFQWAWASAVAAGQAA